MCELLAVHVLGQVHSTKVDPHCVRETFVQDARDAVEIDRQRDVLRLLTHRPPQVGVAAEPPLGRLRDDQISDHVAVRLAFRTHEVSTRTATIYRRWPDGKPGLVAAALLTGAPPTPHEQDRPVPHPPGLGESLRQVNEWISGSAGAPVTVPNGCSVFLREL
ncbi:hypothetical protein GCM10023200_03040 [Actinomycetospora chlora]|uniref:Uncharacterized protein n=1 Tax=Actinomycetospora chlora TaxID=663608 RepID=A0ABP9A4M2_9PSEU